MTVADDLATLRQSVRFSNAQPRLSVSWECNAALDRVEAEVARLERENAVLKAQLTRTDEDSLAEVARLRDGLRRIAAQTPFQVRNPTPESIARALLADAGAADIPTGCANDPEFCQCDEHAEDGASTRAWGEREEALDRLAEDGAAQAPIEDHDLEREPDDGFGGAA